MPGRTNKRKQSSNVDGSALVACKLWFASIYGGIPKSVFAISFFGLFLGMSTTMIYSQIGMFMVTELHATKTTVAVTEGIVEFISFACRILSGVVSDYLCERKLILMFGCVITLFARTMLSAVSSAYTIVMVQGTERVGNGMQATPRDALIADISKPKDRGKAYGFSRTLKTIGCLVGSPLAILIMYLTADNYRTVFMCAAIPVVVAIVCLVSIKIPGESDSMLASTKKLWRTLMKKNDESGRKLDSPFQRKYLNSLDIVFWKIIMMAFIYEMGHFSEILLPLYANQYISKTCAGAESMCVSIGQILLSYPIGLLADRYGRVNLIRVCMICMILANLSFIFWKSINGVFVGAFLWGGQMTAIQGLFLSIITQRIDKHITATAIGVYYIVIGTAYFLSSTIAGRIWDKSGGGRSAFVYSLCVSTVALLITRFFLKSEQNERQGSAPVQ
ncbi:MAG: MFS transporter [Holosporales bacterium]|nr:MFS transporter [Holosporales bacterium]